MPFLLAFLACSLEMSVSRNACTYLQIHDLQGNGSRPFLLLSHSRTTRVASTCDSETKLQLSIEFYRLSCSQWMKKKSIFCNRLCFPSSIFIAFFTIYTLERNDGKSIFFVNLSMNGIIRKVWKVNTFRQIISYYFCEY